MTDAELLASWLDDLARALSRTIENMPFDELAWQPEPEANSIGVTVWHMARWLDILAAVALDSCDTVEEQWFTQGWAERTGYDPRGIGSLGLGAITGYTLEQVKAVPKLTAEELWTYSEQAIRNLRPRIVALSAGDFERPAVALGEKEPRTIYYWIRAIMQGCFAHIGEIQALKALYERSHRAQLVHV